MPEKRALDDHSTRVQPVRLAGLAVEFCLIHKKEGSDMRGIKPHNSVSYEVATVGDRVQCGLCAVEPNGAPDIGTRRIESKIVWIQEMARIASEITADLCVRHRHSAVRYETIDQVYAAADPRVQQV